MGVIGGLMIARTSSSCNEEDSESVVSEPNLESEQNNARSIMLLELICKSTTDSAEAYALFCDELSRNLKEGKLDKNLQEWITLNVLAEFEEMFIIDMKHPPEFSDGVCPKFSLEEINEPIALDLYNSVKNYTDKSSTKKSNLFFDTATRLSRKSNVSQDPEKVLNALLKLSAPSTSSGSIESSPATISPLKLAPLFRLLKTQKIAHEGGLDAIDALLGCPIILPELKNIKFFMIPIQKKHLFLNILFYFINWIREIINAFCVVNDKTTKRNICARLMLLIELEELACKYLLEAKDFVPPPANFDCEEHDISHLKLPTQKAVKRKKGKKATSKKAKTDPTQMTLEMSNNHTLQINSTNLQEADSETEEIIQDNQDSVDTSILNILQPYFRELDFEVFSLLHLGMSLKINSDAFSSEKRSVAALHPKELHFLLEDFYGKVHHLCNNSISRFKTINKRGVGFSNLESQSIIKVITSCIYILPSFCKLVQQCCSYFRTLRDESDGVVDSLALLNKDSQLIAKCMQLIFKIMASVFSWKGFSLLQNADLLTKAFKIVSSLTDKVPDDAGVPDLVNNTICFFMNYADDIPSLACSANLIQLLVSLLQYTKEEEPAEHVSSVALSFLKKNWIELDKLKAAECNINIQVVLEAYISNSKPVLNSLENLAVSAIPQLVNTDGNEKIFNTLNKSSLHCYYKIMLSNLARYMKLYYVRKPISVDEEFDNWSSAIKVFQVLTNLIKSFEGRVIIGSCLKYGRLFLDIFLKRGMPLMDTLFKSKREDVVRLLKTLQMSTRYMQHVCCHSKVLKDMFLTRQVPLLKKSLEVLVYRVKMMLAVNNCEVAFWVGNLKNRDIKGVEILSQQTLDEDDDSNDSEDEQDPTKNLTDQSHASDSEED